MNDLFSIILVGVDDSEPAKHAIELGIRLAHERNGTVVFCNAVNWLPLVARAESAAAFDPNLLIEGMKEQGNALLDDACQRAAQSGVAARKRMVEGDPVEGLIGVARDERVRLIVLGTHGRRGLGRLVLGSTTEGVLRAGDIPVLTVRERATLAPQGRRCFERVLVALDDSEPSDAAAQLALELPPEDRRSLVFVSVADIDSVIGPRGYYHAASIREILRERAEAVVDRALESAAAKGVEARGRVVEGTTWEAILALAGEEQADLIVVGSHGRRGLQRFFLGSVAEHVVRTAAVPVLVVRSATPTREAGAGK